MKRVRLTRDTVVSGRPAMAGEVFDLPDDRAAYLAAIGKAVFITSDPAPREKKPPAFSGLTTESAAALVKGKKRKSG